MMKKKKTKPNQNKKVSYAKIDTLCQLLFKRIKADQRCFKNLSEATLKWAESEKEWTQMVKKDRRIVDILTHDIELKHKFIQDLKQVNEAMIDKYEDQFENYGKANKILADRVKELVGQLETLKRKTGAKIIRSSLFRDKKKDN